MEREDGVEDRIPCFHSRIHTGGFFDLIFPRHIHTSKVNPTFIVGEVWANWSDGGLFRFGQHASDVDPTSWGQLVCRARLV